MSLKSKKITDLNEYTASEIQPEDLFFVTDIANQETKRITAEQLFQYNSTVVNVQSGLFNFLNNGQSAKYFHNFVTVPRFVSWVAVCQSNDGGYVANEEIDVFSFVTVESGISMPGFVVYNTGTFTSIVKTSGTNYIVSSINGQLTSYDSSKWKLKCYLLK